MKGKRLDGNIAYRFSTPIDPKGDILYVNIVPQYSCVNSCGFCSRDDAIAGLSNIYEKKAGANLYLKKAPNVEMVIEEVQRNSRTGTKEVAFVGLGEPLLQFELVRDSIARIRKMYEGNIRIDTNGLVKNWYESPAQELRKAGLDEIRISVNAISEEDYQDLCRPQFEDAFERLCDFVRDCITEGIETKASFVTGFMEGKLGSEDDYHQFASSLGIKPENIILRKYVPPMIDKEAKR